MTKIKKTAMRAADMLSDDIDELVEEDKLDLIKHEFSLAKKSKPNYVHEIKELKTYMVFLPENPDIVDLSKINKLYAIAQSFSSRVTTMEVVAIENESRWKRLVELMKGYIEDRHDTLLTSDEMMELSIPKATAKVRVKLQKKQSSLRKMQDKLAEAASFAKAIEAKKKDLTSVLTTLGKQVKALSLEHSHT